MRWTDETEDRRTSGLTRNTLLGPEAAPAILEQHRPDVVVRILLSVAVHDRQCRKGF